MQHIIKNLVNSQVQEAPKMWLLLISQIRSYRNYPFIVTFHIPLAVTIGHNEYDYKRR